VVLLLGIPSAYKIAEMAVGSKSFPQDDARGAPAATTAFSPHIPAVRGAWPAWLELLIVFALLEAVLWTPRSFWHSVLIVLEVGSVLWFGLRGHTRQELGLIWPSRAGTMGSLALGGLVAIGIPSAAVLSGHPVPANPNWPLFQNLWPYAIWAFAQQFLLLSFFFLRVESMAGARWAVWASTALFTLAHIPNMALTVMTFFGALFFTEMFRRYRSIYPLGMVHALLGIAIAYSFPDTVMHHMRVGLSYWQFR
jgi:membrane protease YdiL (CAAX protease family)